MRTLSEKLLSVCPVVVTGLLLLARGLCESLGLRAPTVGEILAATKVPRSSAYELAAVIAALLPTLVPSPGRPPTPPAPPTSALQELTQAVLDYVLRHPGCAHRGEARGHYSDAFRCFILDLRAKFSSVEVEAFADATGLPLGTLKEWLRLPANPTTAIVPDLPDLPDLPDVKSAQMQTVLDAYARWKGRFLTFCRYAQGELRLPFGRDLLARILEVHGLRRRLQRNGRSPDELALRDAFTTFFPGAQWVGDGMQLPIVVDGQRFVFNLELAVDAHTDAFTGLSLRQQEDATAVVEAFNDGIATTGAPPLALLLDNKPSNHAPEVDLALGDTLRIRATPGRPQNKAHVEGAFGLFSQVLPKLVLDTRRGSAALARDALATVVQVWARSTNHRPRKDRGGRSRVELYREQPTEAQLEQARHELRETAERQERARRTLAARRRPEILALLDTHFARLGLLDPERHARIAIAAYPLGAIVDGIAIFEGKRLAGTLPENADARYLLGIVRNLASELEGEHLARRLLALRLEARDAMLAALVTARDQVCANPNTDHVLADCVDRALAVQSPLERSFWLDTAAAVIRNAHPDRRQPHFHAAARRIEATFAATPRERHDAVRQLADHLVPLA